MIFRVYWDDKTTLTAELDLIYYDGRSSTFKIIDENNNYYDVEIKSEEAKKNLRKYTLDVEGLEIGRNYKAVDERFLQTSLQYRYIVRTEYFDNLFYYGGDDLGSRFSAKSTGFKVWSPVASRVLVDIEDMGSFEMSRGDKGVFRAEVPGNLDGKAYQYLVNISGSWRSANDPYAYSSTANHGKSCVIDHEKAEMDLNRENLPPLEKKTDAIIYELHVRDLSAHQSSGIKSKGKFPGLVEEGTVNGSGDSTGFDYLTGLGISHVQFLPLYDFGSVDEVNQFSHYNWGYDPVHYNVPEGSYATDSSDPYSRIRELKAMIGALHGKGIRVVMDVVYNHMFDRFSSDFEKLVPYYYFRLGADGEPSNGSFCGNDIDSTRLMMRKYILDSIKRWMVYYGIDGFRFDLMGILDVETMNQVADLVESIDENAIVYGEGWNMPTLLPDEKKATMMNQEKLPKIGHFNDYFRDTLKGDTMADRVAGKGLLTGNTHHLSRLPGLLSGSELDSHHNPFFSAPWKSVNYVECHDNHTVFDKMTLAGVPREEIVDRQKLMLACILFSRGIPFIHAGQEMCRTKGGDHNSYKSPDSVNAIDWERRTEYRDLIRFFREAVELRKNTPPFRSMEYEEIHEISVKKLKKLVELKYDDGTRLIINLEHHSHHIDLNNGKVLFNKRGKVSIAGDRYDIQPLELIVIKS